MGDPVGAFGNDSREYACGIRTDYSPTSGYSLAELMADQVAIRTRFFDEVVLDAAGDKCTQVVL
uniref:class I SAM-dependent methyltransferase n=1 Tax=Nocardia abscessus TaxID=120957 RepID=UPI00313B4970